jgi:hypothetical protein
MGDLGHIFSDPKMSLFKSCSGLLYSISIIALISLANFIYLVVFTIAKRFEPFASVKPTRVTVLLIGANELIRPVTPAVDVVNKSPNWYVYPCRVILFSFSLMVVW